MTFLYHHLVVRRGLVAMIVSAWGIMVGSAAALTTLAVIVGVFGGNYSSTLMICLAASTMGLFVTLPAIRKEYFQHKTQTTSSIFMLFLTAIGYGFISPGKALYTSFRVLALKYWLIYRIHKHNRTLEELRIKIKDLAISVHETRDQIRILSRSYRGNPHVVYHRLKNEKLQRDVKDLDQRREDLLQECHRIAGKLGTKLRVYDNAEKVEFTGSVIYLIYIQIEMSRIPIGNTALRSRA